MLRCRLFPLALALVLSCATAQARDTTPETAQHNARLTGNYLARLLAAPSPPLAELTLLMTQMPKGGDLHHHYSGAHYAETYLAWVDKQGYCIEPDTSLIKTNAPTPPGCLSAEALQANTDAYRTLLQRWSDKDFANHSHDTPAPDQQFFATFGYFGPISGYEPANGLRLLKARAQAENVQYLETMMQGAPATDNPALAAAIDALPPDADDARLLPALTALADFLAQDATAQKRIADYRSRLAGYAAGIDDAEFTLRFQTYVSRNTAPSRVFEGLFAAFAAAQDNPLIVGVNIVGPENGTVAMRDYDLHMRMFRFLRQRFPGTHLALHAGELTLGMVPPEGLQHHIRAAVEVAGAERIGHGVDIPYEANADQLLETLAQRGIAVEVNLTSNAFILGVAGNAHPVMLYTRYKVPFVISTDDAGVSRNNLSGEYLLFVTRYKPSYAALKQVVYNSIRHAFLGTNEKARQIKALDARFAAFEARVARMARPAP